MDKYSNSLIIQNGHFTYRLFRFKRIIRELHIDCIYENTDTFCRWLVRLTEDTSVVLEQLWDIFESWANNTLDENIKIVFPSEPSDPFDSLTMFIREIDGNWKVPIVLAPAPVRINDKLPLPTEHLNEINYSLRRQIERYEKTVISLTDQLQGKVDECQTRTEEYEALKELFREKNDECENLRKEFLTKMDEVENLSGQLEIQTKALCTQLNQNNGAYEDILTELSAKNTECNKLNSEYENLRAKLDGTTGECSKLKTELDEKTRECEDLRGQLENGQVLIEQSVLKCIDPAIQESLDDLRTQLNDREESLNLYKKTCTDLKTQLVDTVTKNQTLAAQNEDLMRIMAFYPKTQPVHQTEEYDGTDSPQTDEDDYTDSPQSEAEVICLTSLDDMLNRVLDRCYPSTPIKYPEPAFYKDTEHSIPGKLIFNNSNRLIRSAIHSAVYGRNDTDNDNRERSRYPNYVHEYHVSYCEWKTPNYFNILATSFHIGIYEYGVLKKVGMHVDTNPSRNILTPKTLFRNFVQKYKAKEFSPELTLRPPLGFVNTIFCSDVTITISDTKGREQCVFRHDVRMVGYSGQRTFVIKVYLSSDKTYQLSESDFIKANYLPDANIDDFSREYGQQHEYYKLFYYH